MSISELLILRSASFQQLDILLPEIVQKYPEHRIVMLTHPHSVAIASKYPQVSEIIQYPHKGAFQFWKGVPLLKKRKFDVVVVPISSLSGGGFFNVYLCSLRFRAKRYMVCMSSCNCRPLTNWWLARILFRNIVSGMVAFSFIMVLSPLILLTIPFLLVWLGERTK